MVTKTIVLIAFGLISQIAVSADAVWVGEDLSGISCMGKTGGFGPYDYTNVEHRQKYLRTVEAHHFQPNTRNLVRGTENIWGDLEYTARTFPNHHGAIFALIRVATEPQFATIKRRLSVPVECYLQRAEKFAPRDAIVQFLFGLYLHRLGEHENAAKRYTKGLEIAPNSAEGHYNFGLLLVEMQRFNEAVEHARKAYASRYPLPGLKRKLADAGYQL